MTNPISRAARRIAVSAGLVDAGPKAQLDEARKRVEPARQELAERQAEFKLAEERFQNDDSAYEDMRRAEAFAKRAQDRLNTALDAVAQAEAEVKEQALAAKRKRCDALQAELTVEVVSAAAEAFDKREDELMAALAQHRVERRLKLAAPIAAKQDELRRGLLELGEPVGRIEEIVDGRVHVRDAVPDRTGLVGSLRAVAELLQARIEALPAGDPLRDALAELAWKNYPMQHINAPPPRATVHEERREDAPKIIRKGAWFEGSNGKRPAAAAGE